MKPFKIFRPGTHTASCGTAVTFTKEQLAAACAGYEPSNYASPLVIGHPKTEDRAWGQIEKLTMDDAGDVWAHPSHVEPKFDDLVQSKAFPNRSASWYMPDHPNNPTPGALYLKHVGFLGAAAPALKGLGQIEFKDPVLQAISFDEDPNPDQVVEFADAASASDDAWSLASFMSNTARMLRGLRDNYLADKGVEEADKLVPAYQIEDLERQAAAAQLKASNLDKGGLSPAYNEPTDRGNTAMTPEQIAALQAENDANKAKLASFTERETALAAAEIMATVASIDASLDPLVKAGKILPAQRKTLANFMASLDDKAQVVEFGEAVDGVVPKISNRQFMRDFLAKLPKSVEYTEVAGQTNANSGALTPSQLAEKATALRVKVKADSGREISFTEATNRVLAESGVTVEEASTTAQV